jgi:hypothetical protein
MRPYTMDNIEDWDFRSWRSPLLEGGSSYSDPATIFLEKHLFEVLAIDHVRLIVIKSILDHDLGHLAPEKSALLLTPEGERILHYTTTWRDLFTQDGRLHRRVVRSLEREWKKYGQIRPTLLPPNLRESFPGLLPEST